MALPFIIHTMDNEALTILTEECAEVIQVVSKCYRFGLDNINPNKLKSNRQLLEDELGDVLAMIHILEKTGLVNSANLEKAKLNKFEKLKVWSNLGSTIG